MRFEIYQGNAKWLGAPRLWYWRLVAGNGKIVADGSEGYASKSNARRAVRTLMRELSFDADRHIIPVLYAD